MDKRTLYNLTFQGIISVEGSNDSVGIHRTFKIIDKFKRVMISQNFRESHAKPVGIKDFYLIMDVDSGFISVIDPMELNRCQVKK